MLKLRRYAPQQFLRFFPVAILILLSTTTRTRIIASDLRSNFYGHLFFCNLSSATTTGFKLISFIGGIVLPGSVHFFFVGTGAAHVCFLLAAFFQICILLQWNRSMAKE